MGRGGSPPPPGAGKSLSIPPVLCERRGADPHARFLSRFLLAPRSSRAVQNIFYGWTRPDGNSVIKTRVGMTGTIAKKGILTDGSGLPPRRGGKECPPLLRKLGYKSSLSLRTGLFHAIYSGVQI